MACPATLSDTPWGYGCASSTAAAAVGGMTPPPPSLTWMLSCTGSGVRNQWLTGGPPPIAPQYAVVWPFCPVQTTAWAAAGPTGTSPASPAAAIARSDRGFMAFLLLTDRPGARPRCR